MALSVWTTESIGSAVTSVSLAEDNFSLKMSLNILVTLALTEGGSINPFSPKLYC